MHPPSFLSSSSRETVYYYAAILLAYHYVTVNQSGNRLCWTSYNSWCCSLVLHEL